MRDEIVVVDYHRGNLLSMARGLAVAGGTVAVTDDPARIAAASGVVLPGVGAFEDAMLYLRESGEADAILGSIERGVPFLGVCLGMQLLFAKGDERSATDGPPSCWGGRWVPGLGVLEGSVTRLESTRLKVPHVGWDQIHLSELGMRCPLFVDVPEGANVYFTHSYALADDVPKDVIGGTTHYVRSFASAVWRGTIYGVQFHPEKSSGTGIRVLSNFVRIVNG